MAAARSADPPLAPAHGAAMLVAMTLAPLTSRPVTSARDPNTMAFAP
jgi:hypothetical protein